MRLVYSMPVIKILIGHVRIQVEMLYNTKLEVCSQETYMASQPTKLLGIPPEPYRQLQP